MAINTYWHDNIIWCIYMLWRRWVIWEWHDGGPSVQRICWG